MLKRLIAAGALISLAAAPTMALAQDAAEEEAPATTEAETTPASSTSTAAFAPINYNVQEDLENILLLDLSNGERVAIRLMPSWAPSHVERVKTLARQGFYDGVIFHRVIGNMAAVDAIQRGEPPANPTRIVQASIAADGKPQAMPQPAPPQQEAITADMLNAPVEELQAE